MPDMPAMTAEQVRAELEKLAHKMAEFRCAGSSMCASSVHMYMGQFAEQAKAIAARLSGMAADTWRPIETAPKDRRIELWIPKSRYNPGVAVHGEWDAQLFHHRPRPFWRYEIYHRETNMRERQPSHWRELHAAPEPPHV